MASSSSETSEATKTAGPVTTFTPYPQEPIIHPPSPPSRFEFDLPDSEWERGRKRFRRHEPLAYRHLGRTSLSRYTNTRTKRSQTRADDSPFRGRCRYRSASVRARNRARNASPTPKTRRMIRAKRDLEGIKIEEARNKTLDANLMERTTGMHQKRKRDNGELTDDSADEWTRVSRIPNGNRELELERGIVSGDQ